MIDPRAFENALASFETLRVSAPRPLSAPFGEPAPRMPSAAAAEVPTCTTSGPVTRELLDEAKRGTAPSK